MQCLALSLKAKTTLFTHRGLEYDYKELRKQKQSCSLCVWTPSLPGKLMGLRESGVRGEQGQGSAKTQQ